MRRSLAALVSAGLLLTPLLASAHAHQTLQIGDKQYQFAAGFVGEPVAVDDKTGVEFMVTQLGVPAAAPTHDDGDGDGDEAAGQPVSGLEQTLKVEISAGDQKKVLDLSPKWGAPGSYQALFYPTAQTTFSFRFFGTVNNAPVDITFSCSPAGHGQAQDDATVTDLGGGVKRLSMGGAFGCPLAKADLGFPLPAATLHELSEKTPESPMTSVALALSVVAFVVALGSMKKRKI